MTILVTGAAGFIGTDFVLDWFRAGEEAVANVDKRTYPGNLASMLDDPPHTFAHRDIADSIEHTADPDFQRLVGQDRDS